MTRRWLGLVILCGAFLAAVVTAQMAGTKVAGTAQIGVSAVPGPPRVGDCLLQPITAAQAALYNKLQYPSVSTGPCSDRRYGEVVAIIGSSKIAVGTVSASGVNDPNLFTCTAATTRYLGGPDQLGLGGGWTPSFVTATLAAGPSPQQRAVKQNWIACIEYINPDGPERPRADDYRRTAKLAFSTGSQPPPAVFSTCLNTTAGVDPNIVDCYRPHPAEMFAMAVGGAASTSLSVLANNCATLVSQYTGIPKATSKQLTVKVNVYDQTGALVPETTRTVSGYTAMCIALAPAGRQLTGPLMDVGDNSLPLR